MFSISLLAFIFESGTSRRMETMNNSNSPYQPTSQPRVSSNRLTGFVDSQSRWITAWASVVVADLLNGMVAHQCHPQRGRLLQ